MQAKYLVLHIKKRIMKRIIFTFLITTAFIWNIEAKCTFSFVNNVTQTDNFKTLMMYDIKGISVNNTLICPLNGFNHGVVDYGTYKQRGFYFAIRLDNAALGEGIVILETIDFEPLNDSKIKGMNCTLKEIGKNNNETFKGRFIENKEDGMIYLFITTKVEGQDTTMTYFMIPK